MEYVTIAVFILFAILFISGVQIARDSERFTVIVLGRFVGFKGPGILVRIPGQVAIWHRIKLGDRGEVLGSDIARFGSVDLPVQGGARMRIGSIVRVTGFAPAAVTVEMSPDQVRTLRCPKCGHDFRDV